MILEMKSHRDQFRKVGPDGRVNIPAAIRRHMGLRTGDSVLFKRTRHGVIIESANDAIDKVQGILAGKGLPDRIEREPDRELS